MKARQPECIIILPGPMKRWELDGKLHREDGPAIEWSNGDKQWWLNGKCHRDDGPAIEHTDGYKEWWFNGLNFFSQESLIKYKQFKLLEE